MAYDPLSLADLLVFNKRDLADIEVSDLFDSAPLMRTMNAVPATNGNLHYYFKETGAPVVGFRSENDGRDEDSTVRSGVTVTLKIADCSFSIDKAIADAYIKGPEAAIAMAAKSHLKAMMFALEKQVIRGTIAGDTGDSAGFTGLGNACAVIANAVTSAGGSTALTSVYFIRSGDADCSVVAGNGGSIDFGETTIQRLSGNTGTYPAYYTPCSAWFGLQIGSSYSVGRLANIDAGSYSLTDDRIYSALSEFPADRQPNLIVMNRRSLEQLRNSRTATNGTGAPAPRPTEVEGIRIIVTDAITNDQTAIVP